MTRNSTKSAGAAGGALALGAALLWLLSSSKRPDAPRKKPAPKSLPSDTWQTNPSDYTEADVEAAARMIASENPRGSDDLHIEQIWTQLRARKRGQSLFDRITAGSGYGPQGERANGGDKRPVATEHVATKEQRQLAREVLAGKYPSTLGGAKQFFEPDVQDRAFAIAERARKKQKQGQPLTDQEQRLLKYEKSAAQVRADWLKHSKFVGALEGIEFYT